MIKFGLLKLNNIVDRRVKAVDNLSKLSDIIVDHNMLTTLQMYLFFGLEPGSFGQALVEGNLQQARNRAHSSLTDEHWDTTGTHYFSNKWLPTAPVQLKQDIVQNMFDLAQLMPAECLGEKNFWPWIGHSGYNKAPPTLKIHIKLLATNQWWTNFSKNTLLSNYKL